ncbi:MAG: hypothetical protein J6S60_04660 [Oscillospiraceae bacterium]|nr:hypothetical protein [Oscillospiraceae bacterium]
MDGRSIEELHAFLTAEAEARQRRENGGPPEEGRGLDGYPLMRRKEPVKRMDNPLDRYIGINPVTNADWVRCDGAQPTVSGQYMVILLKRGDYLMNRYRWNGREWITNGGRKEPNVVAWLKTKEAEQ